MHFPFREDVSMRYSVSLLLIVWLFPSLGPAQTAEQKTARYFDSIRWRYFAAI